MAFQASGCLIKPAVNVSPAKEFCFLLQRCGNKKDLATGRKVYSLAIKRGLELHGVLGSYLIRMFAACGSWLEANLLFSELCEQSVFAWSAIILAHADHGQGDQAIKLYYKMQQSRVKPDGHTFVAVLKACSSVISLPHGKLIHTHIIEDGFESDTYVGNTLVDMYGKCASIDDAHKVFNELPKQDVVAWNAMIAGYVQNRHCQEALHLFQQMEHEGNKPDNVTFVNILKACSSIVALDHGKLIHVSIIESGFKADAFVWSTLIDMYMKCGSVEDACRMFDKLSTRDQVTWNAMIAGYALHGPSEKALCLFQQLQQRGGSPDKVTFVNILKACSNMAALEHGKLICVQVIERGFELDVCVGNTVIDMFMKCGCLKDARKVFDSLPKGDVVTWSATIAGYAHHGHVKEALQLFQEMQHEGRKANIVTWNAMIAGCAQNQLGHKALGLFKEMQEQGMKPDSATFLSALKACSSIAALEQGKGIHTLIIEDGNVLETLVGNALVDMYAKCGNLEDACEVFQKLPRPDLVTLNVMLAGYAEHGCSQETFQLFQQMQQEGWNPDKATLLGVLKACSSNAALYQGMLIHDIIVQWAWESDIFIGNSLVDMYAKCGSLQDSIRVFKKMPEQSVGTWNAMIAGYALHCNYKLALQGLTGMGEMGLKPDEVSLISLLSACSHMGLITEGIRHFKSIKEVHGIAPTIEHYNCMVDLLGRAGYLNEAEHVLKTVPVQPNIVGWMSLLYHCRTYGRIELGRQCFDHVVALDSRSASAYMLMSNIYGDAGFCKEADRILDVGGFADVWKKPGKACIEVDNKVHEFVVGDRSHPQIDGVHGKLQLLNFRLKNEGHVLQPICSEEKENALCEHLQKPAMKFGLISRSQLASLQISNNCRVCIDYNVIKVVDSEIGGSRVL